MLELLFVLAASCVDPKMVNRTKDPWNDDDKKMLNYCKKRCPEIYDDAPCLKLFMKYGKRDYDCICGQPSKE